MPKKLEDIILKIFYPWLGVTVLLVILITYQVIFTNFFNQNTTAPWLWLLLCVLPGHIAILLAYFKFKDSEIRITHKDVGFWRLCRILSAIYLAIVVIVLLLLPLNDSGKTYPEDLHTNDAGLILLQLIFIALFLIMVFRANSLAPPVPPPPDAGLQCVFISYNHKDGAIANRLKDILEEKNFKVIIDSGDMSGTEQISEFILRAMRSSHATLNIVSNNSLLSGWVGFETVSSFFIERLFKNRLFIAACIDKDFLEKDFTYKSIRYLNVELDKLKEIIKKQQAAGSDTQELNDEISRVIELKNNLNGIIRRLRSSLCIDISKDHFEENVTLILKSLSAK